MAGLEQNDSVSGRFPATRHSAILALSGGDATARERALDLLVRAYWKPLYKYSRIRWRMTPDDASDLVQSFFATALEKEYLQSYDQSKSRFRTFLRICLERFAANEHRSRASLKRGGGQEVISIEQSSAEQDLQSGGMIVPSDIDSWFEREWARQLFGLAIERLKTECERESKGVHFALFHQYDLADRDPDQPLTYEMLAAQYKISLTDVTNYLAVMRRRFRAHVLVLIRELTASDEEYREEVRSLLGMKI